MDTNELFIGDGKTMVKDLKGIGNICKAPNGRLYAVNVDNFGKATVKPLSTKLKYRGERLEHITINFYANKTNFIGKLKQKLMTS